MKEEREDYNRKLCKEEEEKILSFCKEESREKKKRVRQEMKWKKNVIREDKRERWEEKNIKNLLKREEEGKKGNSKIEKEIRIVRKREAK